MQTVDGDLLAIKKGIIVHQVNCKKVMGAGLALQIRKKYPQHFADFLSTEPKLGNIVTTRINDELYVIGVYGQNGYGRAGRYTNYSALHAGLVKVNMLAAQKRLPVFLPFGIGCGLAGGDWDHVLDIIKKTVPNCTLVKV